MKKIVSKIVAGVLMLALSLVVVAPMATLAAGIGGNDPAVTNGASGSAVDYLNGNDNGTFQKVDNALQPVMAGAYKLMMKIGLGALAIAALVAAICFGLFKDSQAVREHKAWLVRICIAVVIVGSILALIGILAGIQLA